MKLPRFTHIRIGSAISYPKEAIRVNITNISGPMAAILPTSNSQNSQAPGQAQTGPTPDANSGGVKGPAQPPTQDTQKLAAAVSEINKKLAPTGTQVVLAPEKSANDIWFNVVDKASGQVIQKFPPETLRKYLETSSVAGLVFDKRS